MLYLRLSPSFQTILRGEYVGHHNIVNDMMMSKEEIDRPRTGADGTAEDGAVVTIGFVKDAKHHNDVQGFNAYHKNRLIKPFWRLKTSGESCRHGVIGVLEAIFVEPAHNKQSFERTTILSRLEARLLQMQKSYWGSNCHKIGCAPRCNKNPTNESAERGGKRKSSCEPSSPAEDVRKNRARITRLAPFEDTGFLLDHSSGGTTNGSSRRSKAKASNVNATKNPVSGSDLHTLEKLKEENCDLKERLERMDMDSEIRGELLNALQCQRDESKSLETQIQAADQKLKDLNKKQERLTDIFSEDKDRLSREDRNLRKKLQTVSVKNLSFPGGCI
ncbi:protein MICRORCHIDIA 7-like [Quillaja saponaria]|uniref:Protein MICRORCHIDIA 7-like n=1 Tax=Quillaja saponaria TaxID=32244 RepID=A0AAD7KU70_QUISA|nr:protein MICRORCHIDIA 7-like [Quillaja saponaria]